MLIRIITSLIVLMMAALPAAAQDQVRYFDESGHSVGGAFLAFFDAYGGAPIFGYPITEAFEAPEGDLVQYFQRAHFRWDPAAQSVALAPLGLAFREPAPPQPASAFSLAERYFPQTGQAVGWEFLDFYEANHGEVVFGAPITGLILEDGRTVQYFENARFEWWYAETPARPVRLTDLGTVAFARAGLDPDLLRPAPVPGGRARAITGLDARVSVEMPVLGAGESQVLYVHLADQLGDAVGGAPVQVICRHEDQVLLQTDMPPTDARGLSIIQLDLTGLSPGTLVIVEVDAAYNRLTARAETSFQVWW